MNQSIKRREFLATAGGAAAAAMVGVDAKVRAEPTPPGVSESPRATSRVVVLRHPDLGADPTALTSAAVRGLLDEAASMLADEPRAADAWAHWFRPSDRVAIKVNCLGHPTHQAVALALTQAIGAADIDPARMVLWDRTDRELERAGYQLQQGGRTVQCYGTDALSSRGRGGYDEEVSTSGSIGSLYSRIVTQESDALVSAAVLKDHNLAGLSCALKNFYGAIHNPNKYHDNGCDPFVADVCTHRHIRGRLRLAVCDATRPQCHGGPPGRRRWQWPYGGIILSTDPVALDRVALEILERRRAQVGLRPLADEDRPVRYLDSAAARGLGRADLADIEVVSIGRPWLNVA